MPNRTPPISKVIRWLPRLRPDLCFAAALGGDYSRSVRAMDHLIDAASSLTYGDHHVARRLLGSFLRLDDGGPDMALVPPGFLNGVASLATLADAAGIGSR